MVALLEPLLHAFIMEVHFAVMTIRHIFVADAEVFKADRAVTFDVFATGLQEAFEIRRSIAQEVFMDEELSLFSAHDEKRHLATKSVRNQQNHT